MILFIFYPYENHTYYAALNSERQEDINPSELISLLEKINNFLSFRDQQDSHELLLLLLDCVEMVEKNFIGINLSLSDIVKKDENVMGEEKKEEGRESIKTKSGE